MGSNTQSSGVLQGISSDFLLREVVVKMLQYRNHRVHVLITMVVPYFGGPFEIAMVVLDDHGH